MRAVVAGSTGFIGTLLLDQLSDDATFDHVQVLSRRQLPLNEKFEVLVTQRMDEQPISSADVAFCALGTTIRTAGSQEAFYHVDHNLVLAFANNAKKAGVTCFVLVSSVGADPASSNFYLRVKGQTESDLDKLGFESLIILRPSMLMGERKEFRLGELIGKGVMTVFNPLMVGSMAKYKGVQGKTVARAMVKLGSAAPSGTHVVQGKDLIAFDF